MISLLPGAAAADNLKTCQGMRRHSYTDMTSSFHWLFIILFLLFSTQKIKRATKGECAGRNEPLNRVSLDSWYYTGGTCDGVAGVGGSTYVTLPKCLVAFFFDRHNRTCFSSRVTPSSELLLQQQFPSFVSAPYSIANSWHNLHNVSIYCPIVFLGFPLSNVIVKSTLLIIQNDWHEKYVCLLTSSI